MFISIKNILREENKTFGDGGCCPRSYLLSGYCLLKYVRTPRGDITVWCFINILESES